MHTTHSHLLKLRKAAALCAVLFLCACSYERIPDVEEGELTTVTLSAGPAAGEQNLTTKAGLTEGEENSIHDLYILAFQQENLAGPFYLKYYATGRPVNGGDDGQFSFSLRRSVSGAADTKLLLVANYIPYSLIHTGMTYDDVQAVLTSGELTAPVFAERGIPMFGFAGNDPDKALQITDNMLPLSANLLRAVARVDVGVGTYDEKTGEWNKGSVAFDLEEIYVFKPQDRYTLMPTLNNLKYDNSGTPSVIGPSQTGDQSDTHTLYPVPNALSSEAEIYLSEVDFSKGYSDKKATVYDLNHGKRIALVIGGKYQGKPNYYRIDFTTENFNKEGVPLNDILRNHIYRFCITNVTQSGYSTPEAAYAGQPVGLDFSASIVEWDKQSFNSPAPDMFVRMNYQGINGTDTMKPMKYYGPGSTVSVDSLFVIKKKRTYISDGGREFPTFLPYNDLRGEAKDNTFNGYGNGGMYKYVSDALRREGPYENLIIAPDNASEGVQWRSTDKNESKKNRKLEAKQACWDYRGQGQSDWRLPRLSELMLLWMNKEAINSSKGFTSLGDSDETYWTGTEDDRDNVYTVNRMGEIKRLPKNTEDIKVRCVREVRKQN